MLNRITIGVLALIALGTLTFALVGANNGEESAAEVRIVAKKLADGRVEFGLQKRKGTAWGERLLPDVRYFPASARVDRWLTSSSVSLDGYYSLPIWSAPYFWDESGKFSANDNSDDAGNFVTQVSIGGTSSHPSLLSAELAFYCTHPARWSLPGGGVPQGTFSGWLTLGVPVEHEYGGWLDPFHRSDNDSTTYLLAQRYNQYEGGVSAEQRWQLEDNQITREMMMELKEHDTLYMLVYDYENREIIVEFPLSLLDTPVQPNLDYCGEYSAPEFSGSGGNY